VNLSCRLSLTSFRGHRLATLSGSLFNKGQKHKFKNGSYLSLFDSDATVKQCFFIARVVVHKAIHPNHPTSNPMCFSRATSAFGLPGDQLQRMYILTPLLHSAGQYVTFTYHSDSTRHPRNDRLRMFNGCQFLSRARDGTFATGHSYVIIGPNHAVLNLLDHLRF